MKERPIKKFKITLKMVKKVLISLIRFYQKAISPLFPHSCRYEPTCSQYAIMAIEKYGPIKGTLKGIWRILRCNPWSKGGIDYP